MGLFRDSIPNSSLHGFLRQGDTLTILAAPPGHLAAINNAGQIAGVGRHEFVFDSVGGGVTTFDIPGSIENITGINNAGEIVGNFQDFNGKNRGFIRDSTGIFTTLVGVGKTTFSQISGINDAGQIAGDISDSSGDYTFLPDKNGVITKIQQPGVILGINDTGQTVGVFHDDIEGKYRGFFRDIGGLVTTIDFPDSTFTQLEGINDAGQIVGDYISTDNISHVFLATPISAVPLPAAAWLLGSALGGLGFCRRRAAA